MATGSKTKVKLYELMDARFDTIVQDVSTLKRRRLWPQTKINNSVITLESKVSRDLEALIKGITGWNERHKQIGRHEHRLNDHGDRIFAIEQVAIK
ncbi:MAG: hypothetical protein FWE32_10310 [Oscillospiraceae bacterium]|nr:hypothetical protein [Oscillospiraceae bacterium]